MTSGTDLRANAESKEFYYRARLSALTRSTPTSPLARRLAAAYSRRFPKALHAHLLESLQARDRLLALVAHDLRGHLGRALLQLHLLGGAICPTDPSTTSALERLERALRDGTALTEDLLDAAALELGALSLHRRPVCPRELLARTYETHVAAARARGLTLRLRAAENLPPVYVDERRAAQVLDNLVDNAIKFTSTGTVSLEALDHPDGVTVRVIDTGVGIAAGDLESVFQPLWHGDDVRRSGVGLGLAIARALVLAHGGSLAVTSQPGVGSMFEFMLPAAAESASAA